MNPYVLIAATYYNSSTQSTTTSSNALNDFFQFFSYTTIVIGIIGLIILIIAVSFLIRWWMVQTAVFGIQEDIHSIREQIEKDKISQ